MCNYSRLVWRWFSCVLKYSLKWEILCYAQLFLNLAACFIKEKPVYLVDGNPYQIEIGEKHAAIHSRDGRYHCRNSQQLYAYFPFCHGNRLQHLTNNSIEKKMIMLTTFGYHKILFIMFPICNSQLMGDIMGTILWYWWFE